MFFGTDWVVTIQERADGDSFGPLRESIRQGRGRVREMGADYLAYLLVDAVVDAYFPVLDELGDRIHALEGRGADVLVGRHAACGCSGSGTTWSSSGAPCGRCARRPPPCCATSPSLVTAETRIFLRDVYDHAVQALELVETLREMSRVGDGGVPLGCRTSD